MFETLEAIFSVRTDTTYLVAALTAGCALMFFHMTESRVLTVLFTPFAALGALIGVFISRELGFYYSADSDSNIILSGLLGLFVSLVIIVVVARLSYLFVNFVRQKQANRLRQVRNVDRPDETRA